MAAGGEEGCGESREGAEPSESAEPRAGGEPSAGGTRVTREPTRRLFFALWPDETLRAAFAHATHKAVRASGGRPLPAHNLHATLLFLGSVTESRISALGAIAAHAAATVARIAPDDSSPPRILFDRIEFWEKPRVLVATASATSGAGHAIADALAGILQQETSRAGFAPDLKPFRAHVTVARKVARLTHSLDMCAVQWPVTGFALVQSVTAAQGPLYSVINLWALDMRRNN
jgi:RNA 2',3'-cyclic 3'-phosphodiesterase